MAQAIRAASSGVALCSSYMRTSAAHRLREICLILPDAEERETWGRPTFRVRDKIFALERLEAGRVSVWCKAPPGSQTVLVGADPERFFAPPYVGPKGWVGMWLDRRPDWSEVEALVRRSYRLVAPRKLVQLLDQGGPGDGRTDLRRKLPARRGRL